MDSPSITGRVTRSTRRLSVEKSDNEDDLRSTASTPTKKRPAKRLSIKPHLEDVIETDGDNKLSQIMEENPIPYIIVTDLKDSLSDGTPAKDTSGRSLRKRAASTCSPEGLTKSPQTKSPPASEISNTKTPKKTMLKKIENSLLQNIVDSPKPRKKRNSIGDGAQDLTPLRRSRRLSTELNVVVEDPLREEQCDHVQVPITRRGKRLSVVPLQPTLPEENEDQKENESTPISPMISLNLSSSRRSPKALSPSALSPSKSDGTPASPKLPQNTSLTKRDRKSKSPSITITSPMSSLSVSLRSEKSPKTPRPQTANKIDSTSVSPVSRDVSLTRNDRKSRTPKSLSLNKSELISESALPKSMQDVSSTVHEGKSPKTLTPNKSFEQTPNSLNSEDSLLKNVSSSPASDSMANSSTGKLNKSSSRKSMNKVESSTKDILNNVTSAEVTEPAESNNTSSSSNELPIEVCNLSQNYTRRSPRKNKSLQNMSIDEGISEIDMQALSGDTKLYASSKNTSISAEKHNLSTRSLVFLDQSTVEIDGNNSISSKKSNGSFKLKFSDNEETVDEVVKSTCMNASAVESKSNVSVTSSTMRIVSTSPLKTVSPNISAGKSNEKSRKSSDSVGANITDIDCEQSIATSTPFVKSSMDKSRTPSSIKNTSATNKSQKIDSPYETPKRDKINSFTKIGESVDISSGEEDEDAMQVVFLDSQASDAGSNYQSGDSMDESQREEILANEIVEKGESLNSESGESDNDSYEKDSFICSDEDESIGSISSDEEMLEIILHGEDASDNTSKLSKSNESAIWKDEVDVPSNTQPGLSGCTLSATKSANVSLKEKKKKSSIGSNNLSKSNQSFTTSKRESTTIISTSNKSSSNLSITPNNSSSNLSTKTGTPNKSSSDLSIKSETLNKSISNLSMEAETPNKSISNLSMKSETPNKSSSNLSMKAKTPNKSLSNLSVEEKTANKSSSDLSMKAETPNKSISNFLVEEKTPNKSSSNLSMKAETPNKSLSNLSVEEKTANKSSSNLSMKTPNNSISILSVKEESPNKSIFNLSNKSLLNENDVAQSPKRLSIADLNNAAKSSANVESDMLSLSIISVDGITPNELLADLTAGSMSTPNTGKLSKKSVSGVKVSGSTNKRISLDKCNNDSIKEDNVLSTSRSNSSGFYESNLTNSKLISDSSLLSSLKNIETLINSKKRVSLNSSNAESLENKLDISKSPVNASISNTTGLTPNKQMKKSSHATSFGQKDPNKSITKLLNGSGSANQPTQEIAVASPKPACSSMEVDSSDDCENLNESSADVSSQNTTVSMQEKGKSQPMEELTCNILTSKQPETKLKAAASTEFEVEPVNIENTVMGTKHKLEADSLWTCTAGDFQVVKKQRLQPTRSISASDYGSTTSFKIVPLKKTSKALLQVDTNLGSNIVNFKQDMLYGKRCPRKDSSKLLKIQQKLKSSRNRGRPF